MRFHTLEIDAKQDSELREILVPVSLRLEWMMKIVESLRLHNNLNVT